MSDELIPCLLTTTLSGTPNILDFNSPAKFYTNPYGDIIEIYNDRFYWVHCDCGRCDTVDDDEDRCGPDCGHRIKNHMKREGYEEIKQNEL